MCSEQAAAACRIVHVRSRNAIVTPKSVYQRTQRQIWLHTKVHRHLQPFSWSSTCSSSSALLNSTQQQQQRAHQAPQACPTACDSCVILWPVQPGDVMVTSRRRPILTIIEDTGPGVHDTIAGACDHHKYEQFLGIKPEVGPEVLQLQAVKNCVNKDICLLQTGPRRAARCRKAAGICSTQTQRWLALLSAAHCLPWRWLFYTCGNAAPHDRALPIRADLCSCSGSP